MAQHDPRVIALVTRAARKYGVDPAAALAVATAEGGVRFGAVGDGGTSFGPFQLHVGGALPHGKDASWANSQAGIDYAIQQMSGSAKGLKGRAAVAAIVNKFERPAAPGPEIQRAMGQYGTFGKLPSGTASGGGAGMPLSGPQSLSGAMGGLGQDFARQALLSVLMQRNAAFASGQPENPFDSMMMLRTAALAAQIGGGSLMQSAQPQAGGTTAKGGKATMAGDMALPLAKGVYKRGGGAKEHGSRPMGNWQSDRAVDLMAPGGTPVYAVADGVISPPGTGFGFMDKGSAYGHRLTLQTKGNAFFYQHMGSYAAGIKPGARVKKGQVIGYVGDYGSRIGGDHLHFGVERGNPFGLL